MKLIHLSDLHIGKRVNEFSMIEDQKYILDEIINIIDEESPTAIIIAGDVYDKSVPSAEAVELFDDFLNRLVALETNVLIISGNHDSAERLAFGAKIFHNSGVYISPVYNGEVNSVKLSDEHGDVNFYLLPFLKPINVRQYFPEEEINSYSKAIEVVLKNLDVDESDRNVIVTHQFVTDAITSDSEELSIGGTDNVDGNLFNEFDYVALGHIHRPQRILRDTMRYCGTPLKYSFSEANHKKSVTIVELGAKGNVEIETRELTPRRDLREIKGKYMELTSKSFYEDSNTDDYLHITLTDEDEIIDAIGKLRTIYPNIMKLDYDNERTRTNNVIEGIENLEGKSPLENFCDLYFLQNNRDISDEQSEFLTELIDKIWEGER